MGKNVVIMGSTGSIGRSTLDVIRHNPDRYRVTGLTCNESVALVIKQAAEFRPEFVSVNSESRADELRYGLKKAGVPAKVFSGEAGNIAAAEYKNSDTAVIAVVGGIGLAPTLAAIAAKKSVCLANKETIVCGGSIVMREARRNRVRIVPIDSEHSAIFQLLESVPRKEVRRVIITASGGPFRSMSREGLSKVGVEDALRHPNWKMGSKITIDSATLMNKGLEVIEAMWLFGLDISQIDVVVHPQSIIHSMIELNDGSVLAQLGLPDMRIPINYALSYPERAPIGYMKRFDFLEMNNLTFEKPDVRKFPALRYAYEAARAGGTLPAAMNAANEIAVREFLAKKIGFTDISGVVGRVMRAHARSGFVEKPSAADIAAADSSAREHARGFCVRLAKTRRD